MHKFPCAYEEEKVRAWKKVKGRGGKKKGPSGTYFEVATVFGHLKLVSALIVISAFHCYSCLCFALAFPSQ